MTLTNKQTNKQTRLEKIGKVKEFENYLQQQNNLISVFRHEIKQLMKTNLNVNKYYTFLWHSNKQKVKFFKMILLGIDLEKESLRKMWKVKEICAKNSEK